MRAVENFPRMMKLPAHPKFPPFTFILFCLFALVMFLPAVRANAGEHAEPFETITLGAHFVTGSGDDTFERFWKPSAGGRFELATPFYAGIIHTGVHIFNNDNVTDDVLSFSTVFLYLGWGYEWRFPFGVEWFAGFQAGGFHMDTDDPDLVKEVRTESEIGLGLQTRLGYPLSRGWSILVAGDYRRIYTHKRIDYLFIGCGVSYTFESPGWLREFLE